MAQKRTRNQTKVKKETAGTSRPKADIHPDIARAALRVAGRDGWDAASIAAVAKESGHSEADTRAAFGDVWEALDWVLADIEASTHTQVDGYLGDDWRENLMEILMVRFDLAQDYRAALATLPRALAHHPRTARRFLRRFYRTMRGLLLLSGLPQHRCNPATIAIFSAVYGSLIDVWRGDDTPDMAPTMAAIDKRLGYLETAMSYLYCRSKR